MKRYGKRDGDAQPGPAHVAYIADGVGRVYEKCMGQRLVLRWKTP